MISTEAGRETVSRILHHPKSSFRISRSFEFGAKVTLLIRLFLEWFEERTSPEAGMHNVSGWSIDSQKVDESSLVTIWNANLERILN
jgi:hypothetical protein